MTWIDEINWRKRKVMRAVRYIERLLVMLKGRVSHDGGAPVFLGSRGTEDVLHVIVF